jgi:hypothetical protein
MHVQVGKTKLQYDPKTGTFPGAPKSLKKILETDEAKAGIQKGLDMLGEAK